MKAQIIYPKEATFNIEVPNDKGFLRNALSYCWDACNPDSGNDTITKLNAAGARLRSSMVGDIYVVDPDSKSPRYAFVDGNGFKEITEQQALIIQTNVPTQDRVMGWRWVAERFNIGLFIQDIK